MARDDTAAKVFWKPYKSRDLNVMTPNVMGYYFIDNGAVELSMGHSPLRDGNSIWGVTVTHGGERDHPASMCFHTEADANDYIRELGGDVQ